MWFFRVEYPSMWNAVIRNIAWLLGGEVFSRLIRAALVIYAARVLGVTEWGVLSYGLSLAALLTIATDCGISATITKVTSAPNYSEEERDKYFFAGLIIKLILIGLVAVGFYWFVDLARAPISPIMFLGLLGLIVCDTLRNLLVAVLRSMRKMKVEAINNGLVQFLILGLGFYVLTYVAKTAEALVLAYVIGSFLGLLSLTKYLWGGMNYTLHLDKSIFIKLIKTSWPFALLGILGGINLNIDTLMIEKMKTLYDVGLYGAAQKLILILYSFPALIAAGVFPEFAKFAKENGEEFGKLLKTSLVLCMMAALPLFLNGVYLAPQIITLVYGVDYLPAYTTLQILLLSLLINFPATILGNALFAHDKQKEFVKFAVLGVAGNLVFNALLIPRFGIAGAAYSTVITQILGNAFLWSKISEINNFGITKELNKTLLANAITFGLVILLAYLKINLLLIIPFAVLVYGGILLMLKEEVVLGLVRKN